MCSNNRYLNLEYKASGVFGNVYSAFDSKASENVALKVIQLEFKRKDEYKKILREMNILEHLHSRYSLWLIDVFKNMEKKSLIDVWLVVPLMDYDLKMVLKQYNLRYIQIIQIIYQLLMSLKYLYEAGIIHRDLKPSNIGVNKNLDVKLLDFGLAREIDGDMTEYVVTRWYRPIEVFCDPNYTTAVDMWSAGCIFAELFTGNVLFQGDGQIDQVKKIVSITGFPDPKLLSRSLNENTVQGLKLYEHLASKTNKLDSHIRGDIERFICDEDNGDQQCSDNAVQLICQMLDLDPANRPIPHEALKSALFKRHTQYLNGYQPEPPAQKYSFTLDLTNETEESLERMIVDKIDQFKPRE